MNGGGKGDKFGMPDNMGELSKQSLIERDVRNERVEWLRNKSERTIAEIYELYLADWCEMNGKFRKGEIHEEALCGGCVRERERETKAEKGELHH